MPGLNFLRFYPFLGEDLHDYESGEIHTASQAGYERECTVAFCGGEKLIGIREKMEDQLKRAVRNGYIRMKDLPAHITAK